MRQTVDGVTATKHVARVIKQEVLKAGRLEELKNRIRQIANQEDGTHQTSGSLKQMRTRAAQLEKQIGNVAKNLATAESQEEADAVRIVFRQMKNEQRLVLDQMKAMEDSARNPSSIEQDLAKALSGVDRLAELCGKIETLPLMTELFKLVNANLYLDFTTEKKGESERSKVNGGVICFGDSPPPIQIYQGPTDKPAVKDIIRKGGYQELLRGHHADDVNRSQQGSERGMLGNVKGRTQLFRVQVQSP
ncbi:MAG: hypothetical protein QM703_26940 [Gemmatales bacterium]